MNPFPGMDPYLEDPGIWPDFHDRLGGTLSGMLNATLPASYYARLQMRPEMGVILELGTPRRIIPDVTVVKYPPPSAKPAHRIGEPASDYALAEPILTAPRQEVTPGIEFRLFTDPVQHRFVEIRDTTQGHKLITVIEIVSPSNKHPGPDRRAYEAKQREVLESDANLIEIDLLRAGRRLLPYPELEAGIEQMGCDYLILVNRAAQRLDGMAYTLYPVQLRKTLPCIPIPLAGPDPDLPLDLQIAVNRVHQEGPYLRSVNYQQVPPAPLLPEDDLAWVGSRLEEMGVREN